MTNNSRGSSASRGRKYALGAVFPLTAGLAGCGPAPESHEELGAVQQAAFCGTSDWQDVETYVDLEGVPRDSSTRITRDRAGGQLLASRG